MIGFGVVGLRGIGRTHINGILEAKGAKLVAVCDKIESLARREGENHNVKWFTDYRDMLDVPELDVVCICTPPHTHREIALEAFKHGKHVLCEKPIALTVGEADEMIEEARKSGLKLGVAFQYRSGTISVKAKQMIDQGIIGKVFRSILEFAWYRSQMYYEASPWRKLWVEAGGGVLMNQAIHLIDILCWFLGRPKRVFGFLDTLFHKAEVEDLASAIILFEKGIQAVIQASLMDNPTSTKVIVAGSKGRITIDYESGEIEMGYSERDVEEHIHSASDEWGKPGSKIERIRLDSWRGSHKTLIEDMVEAVEKDRDPMISGEEALKSLEIVNGIILSNFKEKPVDIPVDRGEYRKLLLELPYLVKVKE